MTREESTKMIISMAQKCNTFFKMKELKNVLEKEGYDWTEEQIRNRMNLSKSFTFDTKSKLYQIKINKHIDQPLKANQMSLIREQYFLDQANTFLNDVLKEAIIKAKNGDNSYLFELPQDPKVSELLTNKLIELEYKIELSEKEGLIEW